MKNLIPLLIISVIISSCGSTQKKEEDTKENYSKTKYEDVKNYVDTMSLKKRNFNKQIICNGKLRANTKSDISFSSSGIITEIKVRNGSFVKKGELMASLNTDDANIELNKALGQMEKAQIELNDKLIGQGYDADTTGVPATIIKSVKISSGYNNAVEALEAAQRKLEACFLYAPFSGRVANMDMKVHQRTADKFCMLIDDNYFDVEFNLLEAELGDISVGQQVFATPFITDDKKFLGEVTEINPFIDDKGQIKIRAKIKNEKAYLIEGMNVRIVIEKEISNRFVVPKDAVVIRDGYFVIFRYVNNSAVWTYVDIETSNLDSHVITGNAKKQTSISDDDIVIISGNLNLADGTAVVPNAPKKSNKK